ncbi:hypothetical protein IWQ60_007337 [Tieghemiomyces parasiticus]|uniref:DH domain-containing protein n=1 Tax=Tieghemiomyces parasiticus TaxID=78921 RepID=A0A9W7ZY89_9FUNG|nr:hypothetical protein IWQ60_007337 [Tieghemiomyces parasiticus]
MTRMLWRDCLTQKEFEAYAFAPKDIERQELMFEIIHTEADYVRDLVLIREVFIKPLRHLQVLAEREIDQLFGNLEDILPIHDCIKKAFLERQQQQYPVLDGLSDVLLPWVHELHVYSRYLCNQAASLRTMNSLLASNEKFSHFYRDRAGKPECRGLALDAFLILPFQRLLKYPLFLKNLLQVTPMDHSDYTMTQGVIMQFDALIARIQSEKSRADRIDSLRYLESCIKGLASGSLVHPHRQVAREGPLYRLKTQTATADGGSDVRVAPHQLSSVYLILFNDLILVSRPRSRRSSGITVASLVKADVSSSPTEDSSTPSSHAHFSHSPPVSLMANYTAGKSCPPKYTLLLPPAQLIRVHSVDDHAETGLVHTFQCVLAYQGRTEMLVVRCGHADEKTAWLRALNEVLPEHLAARARRPGAETRPLSAQLERVSISDPLYPSGPYHTKERGDALSLMDTGLGAKSRPLSLASSLAPSRWFDMGRPNRESSRPSQPVSPGVPTAQAIPTHRPADRSSRPRAASCVSLGSPGQDASEIARSPSGLPHRAATFGTLLTGSPRSEKKSTNKASQFLLSSVKKLVLPTADAYAMRKFRKQLQDYGREDRAPAAMTPRKASGSSNTNPKKAEVAAIGKGSRPRVSAPVVSGASGDARPSLQRSTSHLVVTRSPQMVTIPTSPGATMKSRRSQSAVDGVTGPCVPLDSSFGTPPPHYRRPLATATVIPLDPFCGDYSSDGSQDEPSWLRRQPQPQFPYAPASPTPTASSQRTSVDYGSPLNPFATRGASLKPSARVASQPLAGPSLKVPAGRTPSGHPKALSSHSSPALRSSALRPLDTNCYAPVEHSVNAKPYGMVDTSPDRVLMTAAFRAAGHPCDDLSDESEPTATLFVRDSALSLTSASSPELPNPVPASPLVTEHSPTAPPAPRNFSPYHSPALSASSPLLANAALNASASYLSRPNGISKPLPTPPKWGCGAALTLTSSPSLSSSSSACSSPTAAHDGHYAYQPVQHRRHVSELESTQLSGLQQSKPLYHPAQSVPRTMRDYYGNLVPIGNLQSTGAGPVSSPLVQVCSPGQAAAARMAVP